MYQRLSDLDSERVFAGLARSGVTRSLRTKQVVGPATEVLTTGTAETDIDDVDLSSSEVIRVKQFYRFSPSRRVRTQIAGSPLAVPAEGSR